MDSADVDDDDLSYLESTVGSTRLSQYDFWSDLNLCCDKPSEQCQCFEEITWDDAAEVGYSLFDSLSDLYEWSENLARINQGYDSCMSCQDYVQPSCVPLRDALLALVKAEQDGRLHRHEPIRVCDAYVYDPMTSQSLNIT